jgi:hypothetical protein
MNVDDSLVQACKEVPGIVEGALVVLPEGLLIGAIGDGRAFDREPLVRSTVTCLSGAMARVTRVDESTGFAEHVFVTPDQLVVILRSQRYPRLGLALNCTRDANLAFVLASTRKVLQAVESTLEPDVWEL